MAVSFGTTFPETREKTIGATEETIKETFPAYDVYRAFTSKIVRKRIHEKEGTTVDSIGEALERLKMHGYEEVYLQSLHIIPGIEYQLVQDAVKNYSKQFKQLVATPPLLEKFEDFERMVSFLKKQSTDLPSGQAVLWMGHGTAHSAFTTYACLDHMLAGTKSYVGAVESYPGINDEIKRLKHAQIEKVYMQPLMMVAGNHAHNDMASEQPDSWKTILNRNGINGHPVLKGLGEYKEIQEMFIDKLSKTIERREN
nr:sirohydrochlorin cobaltochelatase [Limosilactobacillus rudii]